MSKALQKKPIDALKAIISSDSVQKQFSNAMGKHADLFTASLIDVFTGDTNLQKCDPGAVVSEALKAAVLKLPIAKSLGFAYIIPYKKKYKEGTQWKEKHVPTFQPGYKGFIQLTQRTGQVKTINDGPVFEGEMVVSDRLSGEVKITGEAKNEKAIGYFAYFKLLNGYEKAEYWTKGEVIAHAEKYSASYKAKNKIWIDEFDKMASKTVLSHILNKYAPKSVDFLMNSGADQFDDEETPEPKDITPDPEPEQKPDTEKKKKNKSESRAPKTGQDKDGNAVVDIKSEDVSQQNDDQENEEDPYR